MLSTALLAAVGLLIGVVTGGRVRNLGRHTLSAWWVLAAGLALQAGGNVIEGGGGFALVLASYGCLTAFAVANMRLVGMGVVLIGLLLNFAVIAANGGMPVRPEAIVAARIATADELDTIEVEGKRHLEEGDDVLVFLGDIVPVRPLREVLSFGDLVMAVGMADLLANLLRAPRRPRRGRQSRSRKVGGADRNRLSASSVARAAPSSTVEPVPTP